MIDAIIIGGGVIGCSVARELSKWKGNVVLLEANQDICEGTSKANSGIVHAGYDAKPGTLKAKYNVLGNHKMSLVCDQLDVPFEQDGSLVLAESNEEKKVLELLKQQGQDNGVSGLRIVEREELIRMEPNISEKACYGLYAPTAGIVCPFTLTIGMAENACSNGVVFQLGQKVTHIEHMEGGYKVTTDQESYETKTIVNAAGLYADKIHNMVSAFKIKITPRKGEYQLLDKKLGNMVHHTLFQVPGKMGKGVLVTPTVHHNILMGPTAMNIGDKEGTDTTMEGLSYIEDTVGKSIQFPYRRDVITSFAGLRAHEEGGDFILGEPQDTPGFFDAAGIESPGLTAAPAIGEELACKVADYLSLPVNKNFNPIRKGIHSFVTMTKAEQDRKQKENPSYGNIVCRCEMVTEGEIMEAIHRPLGATTVDGIKRRTRAGMGRCQAGFCTSRTLDILARELGISKEKICKSETGSELLWKKTKGDMK